MMMTMTGAMAASRRHGETDLLRFVTQLIYKEIPFDVKTVATTIVERRQAVNICDDDDGMTPLHVACDFRVTPRAPSALRSSSATPTRSTQASSTHLSSPSKGRPPSAGDAPLAMPSSRPGSASAVAKSKADQLVAEEHLFLKLEDRQTLIDMLLTVGANLYLENTDQLTPLELLTQHASNQAREAIMATCFAHRLHVADGVPSVAPLFASRLMKRTSGADRGYASHSLIAPHCLYYLYRGAVMLWDTITDVEHEIFEPRIVRPDVFSIQSQLNEQLRRKSFVSRGGCDPDFDFAKEDELQRKLRELESDIPFPKHFFVCAGLNARKDPLPDAGATAVEWILCDTGALLGVHMSRKGIALHNADALPKVMIGHHPSFAASVFGRGIAGLTSDHEEDENEDDDNAEDGAASGRKKKGQSDAADQALADKILAELMEVPLAHSKSSIRGKTTKKAPVPAAKKAPASPAAPKVSPPPPPAASSNRSRRRKSHVCGASAEYPKGLSAHIEVRHSAVRFQYSRSHAQAVCCSVDALAGHVAYVLAAPPIIFARGKSTNNVVAAAVGPPPSSSSPKTRSVHDPSPSSQRGGGITMDSKRNSGESITPTLQPPNAAVPTGGVGAEIGHERIMEFSLAAATSQDAAVTPMNAASRTKSAMKVTSSSSTTGGGGPSQPHLLSTSLTSTSATQNPSGGYHHHHSHPGRSPAAGKVRILADDDDGGSGAAGMAVVATSTSSGDPPPASSALLRAVSPVTAEEGRAVEEAPFSSSPPPQMFRFGSMADVTSGGGGGAGGHSGGGVGLSGSGRGHLFAPEDGAGKPSAPPISMYNDNGNVSGPVLRLVDLSMEPKTGFDTAMRRLHEDGDKMDPFPGCRVADVPLQQLIERTCGSRNFDPQQLCGRTGTESGGGAADEESAESAVVAAVRVEYIATRVLLVTTARHGALLIDCSSRDFFDTVVPPSRAAGHGGSKTDEEVTEAAKVAAGVDRWLPYVTVVESHGIGALQYSCVSGSHRLAIAKRQNKLERVHFALVSHALEVFELNLRSMEVKRIVRLTAEEDDWFVQISKKYYALVAAEEEARYASAGLNISNSSDKKNASGGSGSAPSPHRRGRDGSTMVTDATDLTPEEFVDYLISLRSLECSEQHGAAAAALMATVNATTTAASTAAAQRIPFGTVIKNIDKARDALRQSLGFGKLKPFTAIVPMFHPTKDTLIVVLQSDARQEIITLHLTQLTLRTVCRLPRPSSLRFTNPALKKQRGGSAAAAAAAAASDHYGAMTMSWSLSYDGAYVARYNCSMQVMTIFTWEEVENPWGLMDDDDDDDDEDEDELSSSTAGNRLGDDATGGAASPMEQSISTTGTTTTNGSSMDGSRRSRRASLAATSVRGQPNEEQHVDATAAATPEDDDRSSRMAASVRRVVSTESGQQRRASFTESPAEDALDRTVNGEGAAAAGDSTNTGVVVVGRQAAQANRPRSSSPVGSVVSQERQREQQLRDEERRRRREQRHLAASLQRLFRPFRRSQLNCVLARRPVPAEVLHARAEALIDDQVKKERARQGRRRGFPATFLVIDWPGFNDDTSVHNRLVSRQAWWNLSRLVGAAVNRYGGRLADIREPVAHDDEAIGYLCASDAIAVLPPPEILAADENLDAPTLDVVRAIRQPVIGAMFSNPVNALRCSIFLHKAIIASPCWSEPVSTSSSAVDPSSSPPMRLGDAVAAADGGAGGIKGGGGRGPAPIDVLDSCKAVEAPPVKLNPRQQDAANRVVFLDKLRRAQIAAAGGPSLTQLASPGKAVLGASDLALAGRFVWRGPRVAMSIINSDASGCDVIDAHTAMQRKLVTRETATTTTTTTTTALSPQGSPATTPPRKLPSSSAILPTPVPTGMSRTTSSSTSTNGSTSSLLGCVTVERVLMRTLDPMLDMLEEGRLVVSRAAGMCIVVPESLSTRLLM